MCGRYTLAKGHQELEGRFDYKLARFEWVPRYNIAPTQSVVAVLNESERRAETLRWGLIPFWAKDPKIGSRMINARAESIAQKPSFRRSLRERRCLVLADGFYEWRKDGGTKVPMRIALKSGEAFAFAGLWDAWKSPSQEVIRSCTIITTTTNSLVEPIHDRMPVILARESESRWLDPDENDPGELLKLLSPYEADAMEAYAVATIVNSPRNDSPECIRPVAS